MGAILVTGASRGIGRGIALELAAAGHRVAIHYNGNRAAAEATAKECAERYAHSPSIEAKPPPDASMPVFQADIAVAADRERLVDEVHHAFGRIDGLVNNAGIAPRKRDDIIDAEEDVFDEVLRVNLYGPYFLTQLVARGWLQEAELRRRRESADGRVTGDIVRRIVFVTSISADTASTSRGEYCVSKAGLGMAAQLFAARLAAEGILVVEIRPGITETDMTSGVKGKYDELIGEGLVPQGRWGYPKDTGAVVASVMDGHLDFSPGSVIYTDGGLHIARL